MFSLWAQFCINMQRVTLFVFCLGAVVLSVNCGSEVDNYMDTIIQKTNKVLLKYDEDLDKAVPFKELRASLKALDLMAKDYQGSSRDPIYKATHLGYQATDKYYEATDAIFAWCVKAEVVIDYIIDSEPDRSLAYRAILKLTGNGLTTIKASLAKLNEVRDDLTNMADKLRPVPSSLTKELAELRQEYEQQVRKMKTLKWTLMVALSLLGAVASIVLGFLTGPIGLALGIAGTIAAAGVPVAVIQGKVEPSQEEKWKITEAYYKSLIQAVQHAQGNITAVKDSLNVEIKEVGRLKGTVEGQLFILTLDEEDQSLSRSLVNSLVKFKKTLGAFIGRHSGGGQSRRRREILSECHGLDVEGVSYAVDTFLNGTATQREEAFWRLPALPVTANHFMQDLKFALV